MPEDTGTKAQGAKSCGWQDWQWLRAPAVARARQRVAQSGLGRAGSASWCRRWQFRLLATRARLGEGEDEVTENFWPSPGLNKVQKAAKESFPPNFAVIAKFS